MHTPNDYRVSRGMTKNSALDKKQLFSAEFF